MNLHVVHMLEEHAMFRSNATAIAREDREVRGVLVQTTDATRGHDRRRRVKLETPETPVLGDHAATHAAAMLVVPLQ